ncbi:MAG: AAA family ATPase [Ruminococcaceae bacterium]|nr:AAA family ATPase [Oscillospiraceae bacterium]
MIKYIVVKFVFLRGGDCVRAYFKRLLGNEETKSRVARAIEDKSLAHAFLIGGPSGSGKTTLALEMAAAINCENASNKAMALPCGSCNSCRRIYDGNFPDLKFLSKKKDKATIGVDEVKDFREDMFLSSTEADKKIYVIDDAECMTVEAQNALLKVLEEPPSAVIILMLATECDRILTTIKSRVQYIPMSRFAENELAEILTSQSIAAKAMSIEDRERFNGIIMSADGRIGEAKKLLLPRTASENEEERRDITSIVKLIGQKNAYDKIYTAMAALPQKRSELIPILERLVGAIHDLIVVKYSSEAKTVFFASADTAREACGDISEKRLLFVYDAVLQAHELCIKNANVQNVIINLSSKIKMAASH